MLTLEWNKILSALYLTPFLHIFEKHIKNLKIPVSMLSFANDGLLIAQSKSFSLSNALLFSSYNIASNLLSNFGLIIENTPKLKYSIFQDLVEHSIPLFLTFPPLEVPLYILRIPRDI